MAYTVPTDILEVMQKLEFEEALPAGDARYVETEQARGSDETLKRLARKFGWDMRRDRFFAPNDKHVLFFGHIGSGKTTELRRYMAQFNASKHFYVVEVDVLLKLDRNNLQYTEVLMAMAEALLERLRDDADAVHDDDLRPIHEWFSATVKSRAELLDMSAEIKGGVELGGGIPGLIKLLSAFTSTFKTGTTHKTEWRREIRNRFTSLALAFNAFIRATEARLKASGRAERVLFLIDGTDKMRGEDTSQFFVHDAEQLLSIQTLTIYTAPLHLKYHGALGGKLDADIVLPMIKLADKEGQRWDAGWDALRKLLLQRADRGLFETGSAGEAQIDRLVAASGGHPRELLRLLKLCCEVADDLIDAVVVGKAIAQLASEYRRFLEPEDYAALARIDADPVHGGNDERAQSLLYRLALLEYNDGGWRRSHPVIRELDGYRLAAQKLVEAGTSAPAA
jgi:hypothetical protein